MTRGEVPSGRGPFSVAICTYNRANRLAEVLCDLLGQEGLAELAGEVIIVDNNCTDNTVEVVEAFRERLPVAYVRESRQGLAHARNRAIEVFTGDWLLFTDDDVRLEPNWLKAYAEAAQDHPEAAFMGGRILPRWRGGKPTWVRDVRMAMLAGVFGTFDLDSSVRRMETGDPAPFGANFALSRRLVEELGGFDPRLGVVGEDRGRGEETEYLGRTGVPGVYVGSALCWHWVERERLRLPALYRYGVASGRAQAYLLGDSDADGDGEVRGSRVRVLWHLLRGIGQWLRGRGDRFRQCVINAGVETGLRRGYRLPSGRD